MTSSRKTLIVVLALLALLAAGAGGLVLLSDGDDEGDGAAERPRSGETTDPLPAKVTYVALGDSIAAGFGLSEPGDAVAAECGRSSGATVATKAYTDLVREELVRRFPGGVTDQKLACGGATSAQMAQGQVDAANKVIGDSAAVVTITIGANDYRFTDPATYAKALSPDDDVYRPWRDAIEKGLRRQLADSLTRLGRDKPNRRILVTDYYDPFNAESVVYTLAAMCRATGSTTSAGTVDCGARTGEIVEGLNDTIEGAVEDYRSGAGAPSAEVTVVEGVTDAFEGHEGPRPNCGTAAPDAAEAWVQGPPRALVVEYLSGGEALEQGQDCFHLNAEGHRQLAVLVVAHLPNPGD